jgi:hypothetical protein
MRIIRYPRRGGKTVWLMNRMRADPNGIIVCITEQEVQRLMHEYPDIPIGRFISVDEILHGKLQGLHPEPNLYVDNADIILESYLRAHVSYISVTEEV